MNVLCYDIAASLLRAEVRQPDVGSGLGEECLLLSDPQSSHSGQKRGMIVKKHNNRPTAAKFSVLRQLGNLIPAFLVPRLAREHQSEEHARTFSHWSHVVALL